MQETPQATPKRKTAFDKAMSWLYPISTLLYIFAFLVLYFNDAIDLKSRNPMDWLFLVAPLIILVLGLWLRHLKNLVIALFLLMLVFFFGIALLQWGGMIAKILFLVPVALIGLTMLSEVFRNAKLRPLRKNDRPKNIIVCIDGTWNYPGQKDGERIANTNVYKFFDLLAWDERHSQDFPLKDENDQQKIFKSKAYQKLALSKRLKADCYKESNDMRQIALYYNGVGNAAENNALGRIVGGAFGHGATQIMFEAFADLVELYRPGDQLYVLGFSRGAAIARMLSNQVNISKMAKPDFLRRVINRIPILPFSFPEGQRGTPKVRLLAVWDTVAAFGLAKNVFGIPFQKINLFKDFNVAENVENGLHILSVDDQRDAFLPTHMNPDPKRITQVWFPGIHADVGGGYADCQLSDITLQFLVQFIYLKKLHLDVGDKPGLRFRFSHPDAGATLKTVLHPDANAPMHNEDSPVYESIPRTIPTTDYIHESVFRRLLKQPLTYQPPNLRGLLNDIRGKQQAANQTFEGLFDLEVISNEQTEAAKAEIERLSKLKIWYDKMEFRDLKNF